MNQGKLEVVKQEMVRVNIDILGISSIQFSSVTQSCPTLYDPMNRSMPGLPVHERNQPWDFFGGNDAEAETPILWPPHAKSGLTGKD